MNHLMFVGRNLALFSNEESMKKKNSSEPLGHVKEVSVEFFEYKFEASQAYVLS